MNTISAGAGEFSLDHGIDQMHRESEQWMSAINFWKLELKFFQKLLDLHAHKFVGIVDKKKIDHFQNLITYYTGELLDVFFKEVRQHEKLLAETIMRDAEFDEGQYIVLHGTVGSRINSFATEYRMYKKEFIQFIDQVI